MSFFGSSPSMEKLPTGTKEQTQFGGVDLIGLLQSMMQPGGGLNAANQYDQSILQQGPEAFNKFSSPYLQQFNEQIVPQIAERFGGMGALSSSGFAQALGGAGAGLQSQLAQLFSQLQGQAAGRQQNQFANLSQTGLNYQPFAYKEDPGSSGSFIPLITGLMSMIGGPAGAAAGSGLGLFANLFSQGGGGGGGGRGGGFGGGQVGTNTSGNYGLPTFLGM